MIRTVVAVRPVARSWGKPLALAALALAPMAFTPATQAQGRVRDHRPTVSQETASAPTERWVKLDFDNAPLDRVLRSISQQSRLDITFFDNVIAGKKVTVHAESIAVYSALQMVLKGTDLKANILPSGNVSIVDAAAPGQTVGSVEGTVTDSVGNEPVAGVRVVLIGTSFAAETDKNGRFRIPNVPAGPYVVRVTRLGYLAKQAPVVVRDKGVSLVSLRLHVATTRLTEVVTTTVGNQERLKVGNDVGTINADSLVQNTLIRSVSDLLNGHTSGVQVTATSGAVGAPSKIRIRGVTSPQLNNDPIVVVDGIRVNAQTTANTMTFFGIAQNASQVNTGNVMIGRPGAGTIPAPSPLDQIDPNSIESMDILRGPTATALYGPDASTGVIVIKTKRGQAGPWRYHLGADYGQIIPMKDYPLNYTGWGRPLGGAGASQPNCNLTASNPSTASQTNGGCVLDSVTAFNALNDPQMTNVGTGYSHNIVADASGGGSTVQGFLQGDYSDATGQQMLSKAEQRRLARAWTVPVPSWMKRPNVQSNAHMTSRLTAQFTPNFDISATGAGTYQTTRNDGTGITQVVSVYGPGDTLSFNPAEALRGSSNTSTKRALGSGNARFQPASWLVLTGSGGLDYSLRDDQLLTRSQDCATNASCSSMHSGTHTEIIQPSFTMGATLTYGITNWLSAHTAFGEQFSRTQSYILGVSNNNLAFGQNTVTGSTGLFPQMTEANDQSASAGWYGEQQFAFNQRLFLTAAFRRDASSSFGNTISTPTFPKYDASWLVSNESFFPKQGVLTQLRVRAAYGESGKQGAQTDVLRNFGFNSGLQNGVSVPSLVMIGLGNSDLQPQRDQEWEGGFDLSFYNDRATLTATWYRKQSKNAIITVNVPPSPGVLIPLQAANVGAIKNSGTEVQFAIRPIDTRIVAWDFNLTASANSNLLKSGSSQLANLPANATGTTRIVAGYPLFGYWERPIVSYGDYNNNGILENNEIAFGDSAVYVGSADPKGSYNYANSLTFLGGRFRMNSLISQVNGLTTKLANSRPRAAVDPKSSLAEQAAYLQSVGTSSYTSGGAGGYIGTVSYVSFAELSASYTLPDQLSRRLHSRSAVVTVAARNLALWSNYRGADPTTNTSAGGDGSQETANTGLSQPKNWVLRFNFQF